MTHKVIIIKDGEEDFEYATLIVPEELSNDIQMDIDNMGRLIYNWDEDYGEPELEFDNLYDYIEEKYGQYIDHTPIIVEIY